MIKKLLDNKKICKAILTVYIFILIYFVIFKLYMPFEYIMFSRQNVLANRAQGYYNINLIPFHSILSYFDLSVGINYWNILGNTIPFAVLGALSGTVKKENTKLLRVWFFDILLIFLFEMIQFVICIGTFDVDDIILNGSFCYIGIVLYKWLIDKINR